MSKEDILNKQVDEDELKKVNGGGTADGPGGCAQSYYLEKCTASVEKGSDCWSTDYCSLFNRWYHLKSEEQKLKEPVQTTCSSVYH